MQTRLLTQQEFQATRNQPQRVNDGEPPVISGPMSKRFRLRTLVLPIVGKDRLAMSIAWRMSMSMYSLTVSFRVWRWSLLLT